MDLKRMVQTAQELEGRGDEDPMARLFVVPRHTAWIERPENEQVYSEEAIATGISILRQEKKHRRDGRFSPSSIGECERRLMFGFQGAPQDGINLDSLDLMSMGTRDHFWWQLEALTMGWMLEAEVWAYSPEYKIGGSLDGVLSDGSIFELKTVMSGIYSRILREGPKFGHVMQIHAYMLCTGREWASLVYQSRDTGEYQEFRIEHSPATMDKLIALLERLNRYVEIEEMPEILDDCEMRQGTYYRQCPFRTHCLKVHRETGL